MRCREIVALWDETRGTCSRSLKVEFARHVRACSHCQSLYEECEGVAYRLSSLPEPEPSCDLARKVIAHITSLREHSRIEPIVLTVAQAPFGRLYVGLKGTRIAYVSFDMAAGVNQMRERIERRLHRPVVCGETPAWLQRTVDRFFKTFRVDDRLVDLSDLTPFEQAALRAAAAIPPGQVRSYGWIALQIGRPQAVRAVGQVMARNPLPLFFPCHRVVAASGDLHNYGYGLEMKARLLEMEGYKRAR